MTITAEQYEARSYDHDHIEEGLPLSDLPAYRSVPDKCGLREIMILRGAISEVNNPGQVVTTKASRCTAIARRELGLTGTSESVTRKLFALMLEHGMIEAKEDD